MGLVMASGWWLTRCDFFFFLRRKQMSWYISGQAGQADEVNVCLLTHGWKEAYVSESMTSVYRLTDFTVRLTFLGSSVATDEDMISTNINLVGKCSPLIKASVSVSEWVHSCQLKEGVWSRSRLIHISLERKTSLLQPWCTFFYFSKVKETIFA